MVLFNYSTKELTAKIVYYGPGLCGKTTNLQYIHLNLSENVKGKMLSLATKTDRTLFFDFLPMDLGEIRGMNTRMQLYTVPGQVFYNETRKLVLKGVDGIVFVADSQQEMLNANIESFKNLEENLKTHGLALEEIPHVIQFNKSDLPKLSSIEDLNQAINKFNAPFYESVATTGIGVQDTLKAITKLVLLNLTQRYQATSSASSRKPLTQPPVKKPAIPIAAEPAIPDPPTIPVQAPTPVAPQMAAAPGGDMAATASGEATGMAMVGAVSPDEPPLPVIAADDGIIDDLVDEVQDSPLESASSTASTAEAIQELDALAQDSADADVLVQDSMDSDGSGEPGDTIRADDEMDAMGMDDQIQDDVYDEDLDGSDAMAEQSLDAVDPTAEQPSDDPLVRLTEVVEGHELFDDPSLDVATLANGQQREIIIPVELAAEGQPARRFTLSLKLKMSPVD